MAPPWSYRRAVRFSMVVALVLSLLAVALWMVYSLASARLAAKAAKEGQHAQPADAPAKVLPSTQEPDAGKPR